MISYLLSQEMNCSFNVKVAKIFGLCSAVYLSFMLTEQYKAMSSNKLYNDKYFACHRDLIYDRTTIGDGKQKEIEENLIDCQVLVMLPFSNNNKKFHYYIDEKKLEYILEHYKESDVTMKPEAKKSKDLVPKEALPKLTAKQVAVNTAMKAVTENDLEIYNLYKDWVEVLVTKNGYCAQSALRINQEDLNKYAGNNKQIKIDILRMAIKTGWKDIKYCITDYDKERKTLNLRNSKENQYQAKESTKDKEEALAEVKGKLREGKDLF